MFGSNKTIFGSGKTTVVTYDNSDKIGTATATVTLKRNAKAASANEAYPFGGSVKVKYQIVPHTNNKLILSE